MMVFCLELVGATGFEPATSASRTQRSAKLSYAPKILKVFRLETKIALSNVIQNLDVRSQ